VPAKEEWETGNRDGGKNTRGKKNRRERRARTGNETGRQERIRSEQQSGREGNCLRKKEKPGDAMRTRMRG